MPRRGLLTPEIRQHSSLNQITVIRDEEGNETQLTYDLSGNLLNDGTRKYEWDALNRLKKVYKDPNTTPVLIGEYTYDAQGRRIRKVVTNSGLSGTIPNATTDYIYTNWQCLEERDGSNVLFKQYVWGTYIDELLKLTTNTTINGNSAGDYYPLQDLLYRTTALTNPSGSIIETYDTDAYGNTLIFTSAGTGSDWFADDATQGDNPTCEHLFTGRRYDAETRNHYYRARYYAPASGRFLSRDLIGYIAGMNQYLSPSNPRASDPSGMTLVIPYGTRRNVCCKLSYSGGGKTWIREVSCPPGRSSHWCCDQVDGTFYSWYVVASTNQPCARSGSGIVQGGFGTITQTGNNPAALLYTAAALGTVWVVGAGVTLSWPEAPPIQLPKLPELQPQIEPRIDPPFPVPCDYFDRRELKCRVFDCTVSADKKGCVRDSCPRGRCDCIVWNVDWETGDVLECSCQDPQLRPGR